MNPAWPGPWDGSPGRVRIVKRPLGEAPEWVRDAWIGLELPLAAEGPVTTFGVGVLTGPGNRWQYLWRRFTGRIETFTGYVVDANAAVRLLERTNPTAAVWWRANAGLSVQPGAHFIFDLPACEKAPRA